MRHRPLSRASPPTRPLPTPRNSVTDSVDSRYRLALCAKAVSSFGGWLVRNAAVVGYLVFDLVETLAVVLLWRAPLTELHAMLI